MVGFTEKSPVRGQFTQKKRQLAQNQLANIESIFLFWQNHYSDSKSKLQAKTGLRQMVVRPLLRSTIRPRKKLKA